MYRISTNMNTPLYRPPAESGSLILQINQGCPYNRCAFCGMYKDVPYRRLGIDEILRLLKDECAKDPDTNRVFLADGDVMRLPSDELKTILYELNSALPRLARVNTYATGSAILAKSVDDLRQLRSLKLNTLYLGLESGDDETLQLMQKGETAEQMTDACIRAQECGLKMSVMVLLGLGGRLHSARHADATAEALNRIQPRLLSALRVIPVPGTKLYRDLKEGRFEMLSEHAAVDELRRLLQSLELKNTVFRADHSSNIFPVEARLPRDKESVIATLDQLLTGHQLNKHSPGPMPMWL